MSSGKWKKPTGVEQTTRYKERKAKLVSPKDTMLADFLRAKTAEEKRKVIESFAPHYFSLTPTDRELKQRKEQNEQVEV